MHAGAKRWCLAIGLLPLTVWGQDGAPPASPATPAPLTQAEQRDVVNVQGMRSPELKSYRAMLKGNAAFQRLHALAPQASLKFRLLPREYDQSMEGVTLRIAGDEMSVPVEIDQQFRFALPEIAQLANTDAELILNRKRKSVAWVADVQTPGVPSGSRRLGDLRLECEVRWAVEYDDVMFVQRAAFNVLGGPCGSTVVNVYFLTPRKLKAVVMRSGDKEVELPLGRNGWTYVPPIHDKALSDDTLLEMRYDGS